MTLVYVSLANMSLAYKSSHFSLFEMAMSVLPHCHYRVMTASYVWLASGHQLSPSSLAAPDKSI